MKLQWIWNMDVPSEQLIDADNGETICTINYDDGPEVAGDAVQKALSYVGIEFEIKEVSEEEMNR